MLLIPMGLTNEFHEPNVFMGVHRPFTEKYIIPTTWREKVPQAAVRTAQLEADHRLPSGEGDGPRKRAGTGIRRVDRV